MNEWDTRREAFLKEYKELIDKHSVDFISYPIYQPNREGVFELKIQTEVLDKKMLGVPSDIIVNQ